VSAHQIKCELKSASFWKRLLFTCLQLSTIAYGVFRAGLKTGVIAFGGFLVVWFFRSWRDGRNPNLKQFERNAAERAAILYRVVSDLQRREQLGPEDVGHYRQDVLRFIAQYVRDHRRDSATPTIFANLLVEDGEDLVVIARDHDHRRPLARYRKDGMLVAAAIASGEVQLTGNVHEDFPGAAVGKPYVSILVIPVFFRQKVVGAVSIDSSSTYHFDLDARELVDHLAPYVAMLGWTLAEEMTRFIMSSTMPSTDGGTKP
jgi:hypothetical protein